jgi:hypothetical protein
MQVRDSVIFFTFAAIILSTILIGMRTGSPQSSAPAPASSSSDVNVPNIGSIEILNGCGSSGVGKKIAAHLRAHKFDVKSIGNAPSWNYPFTIVVSRTRNMDIAEKVAAALSTDKVVMERNGITEYDVTVLLGADYQERIQ